MNSLLIKLDKNGEIVWFLTASCTSSRIVFRSISSDDESVYIVGYFDDNAILTLNNTNIIGTLDNQGHTGAFLLVIDIKTGNLKAKQYLSSGYTDVVVDPNYCIIDNSNIVIAGSFTGTNLSLNGSSLISPSVSSKYDAFLLLINKNSLTNIKDPIIFKSGSIYSSTDNINKLYSDNNGFYLVGDIYSTSLSFNIQGKPIIITPSVGKYDFFILRTDKLFNNQWLIYSSGGAGNKHLYSATNASTGTIALIGENTSKTTNITYSDATSSRLLSSYNNLANTDGKYDILLVKTNSDVSSFSSKLLGTVDNENGRDILSVNNNYVITGNYVKQLYTLTDTIKNPPAVQNGYIALLDDNLNLLASKRIDKTAGTADISKLTYNNLDMNYMIGTMYGSSATTSSTATFNIKGATPYPTTLTTPVGTAKQMLIANSCPLIAISTVSTSNIIYNPSTTTTGSIALDVKGDVFRGYSYNWIKAGDAWSAKSSSVNNLAEGDYKVTVNYLTDQCSKSRAFSVRPAIEEISVSNVAGSCNTNNSSITAKARRYFSNGSLIQFSIDSINWNDGTLSVVSSDSTYSYTFSNLYAGNYPLYYRIKTKTDYILKGSSVTIAPASTTISGVSLSVTPTGCKGESNGAIKVNATATDAAVGGTLSYSYDGATGSYSSTNPSTGLSAGSSYDVYVKNSTGCMAHAGTVNFSAVTSALTASASACYVSTEPTSNTAGIKLSATGGLAPYAYSLSQGLSVIPEMSPGTFAGLSYGTTYDYVVTDVTGCSTTATPYKIGDAGSSLFKVDVTTNNILCSDNNVRGELIATPTGGVSPYSYYFDYGSNNGSYHDVETVGDWGNLSSGTYNIKVDDAAGCEVITTKTLSPVIPMPTPFYTKN